MGVIKEIALHAGDEVVIFCMKLKKKLSIQVITTLFQGFGTFKNRKCVSSSVLFWSSKQPCHILRFTMTLVSLFLSYKSQVDENQIKLFKTIKQGLLRTLSYFFLLEQMTLKLALLPLKLQVSLHYHIWQRKNHVIHFTTINLFGRDRETIIKIIRHLTKSNEFWTLNKLLYLPENFMSNNYFELIKIMKEPTTKHALVFLSIIIIIIIIIYFLFCLYA